MVTNGGTLFVFQKPLEGTTEDVSGGHRRQELLGHATIDMTRRCLHVSPDIKRDAVQLLNARQSTTGPHAKSSAVVVATRMHCMPT